MFLRNFHCFRSYFSCFALRQRIFVLILFLHLFIYFFPHEIEIRDCDSRADFYAGLRRDAAIQSGDVNGNERSSSRGRNMKNAKRKYELQISPSRRRLLFTTDSPVSIPKSHCRRQSRLRLPRGERSAEPVPDNRC